MALSLLWLRFDLGTSVCCKCGKKRDTNEDVDETDSDTEKKLVVAQWWWSGGVGRIETLGLVSANYYI